MKTYTVFSALSRADETQNILLCVCVCSIILFVYLFIYRVIILYM